jgi:hypothetical protein
MSYLRYLCLFGIVVSNTLYYVFASSCVPYISIFSGYLFLISPSVFSSV